MIEVDGPWIAEERGSADFVAWKVKDINIRLVATLRAELRTGEYSKDELRRVEQMAATKAEAIASVPRMLDLLWQVNESLVGRNPEEDKVLAEIRLLLNSLERGQK